MLGLVWIYHSRTDRKLSTEHFPISALSLRLDHLLKPVGPCSDLCQLDFGAVIGFQYYAIIIYPVCHLPLLIISAAVDSFSTGSFTRLGCFCVFCKPH